MKLSPGVALDFLPHSAVRARSEQAVACVSILTATSTIVTAIHAGHRVHLAATTDHGRALAQSFVRPLLLSGDHAPLPPGFDGHASPALVPDSSSTPSDVVIAGGDAVELLLNAAGCPEVYLVSLRNLSATARWLAQRHERVALLGAGSQGELCCEDQLAVAWLAERLLLSGLRARDGRTLDLVQRWSDVDSGVVRLGATAEALRRLGRAADVDVVLRDVDDLDLVCRLVGSQVVPAEQAEEMLEEATASGENLRPIPIAAHGTRSGHIRALRAANVRGR